MIFTNFDRHVMHDILGEAKYIKKSTDMYAGGLPGSPAVDDEGNALDPVEAFTFGGDLTTPNYTDQIPPQFKGPK